MTDQLRRADLSGPDDIEGFWRAALAFDEDDAPEHAITFEVAGEPADLFGSIAPAVPTAYLSEPPICETAVPPQLRALLATVLLHADARRFQLGYRLLRRLRSEPHLLSVISDCDVARALLMQKAVERDMHKMTAFVRFREVVTESGPAFVSWFEPEHHIVAAIAPFFVKRFTGMRWSILTPRKSAHWDGSKLTLTHGAKASEAPRADPVEDVWRTYYAHIFNPSRLNVRAMQTHMPKKYWRNLPETSIIQPLVRAAGARSQAMIAAEPTRARRAAPGQPPLSAPISDNVESTDRLSVALQSCQRCPLYKDATQAVPGEGPDSARLMLVGEQAGDQEDIEGRPFVGPAGKVLDAALQRVGIDRSSCFVTNAVKHFKFEPRGKRRLHKKPSVAEVDHCRWWLDHERSLVKPALIVALGATAARSVFGRAITVGAVRGRVLEATETERALVTVHPSYLLRLEDPGRKKEEWAAFLADLRTAKDWLAHSSQSPIPQ